MRIGLTCPRRLIIPPRGLGPMFYDKLKLTEYTPTPKLYKGRVGHGWMAAWNVHYR